MSEQDVTQDLRVPWEEDPGELYEHAPCGYLTTLPDGTIVKVNETFLAWTGYQRSDLVGRRRFRDLLSPGGQIYHETHYAPLLRMQDDVQEIAFDMICADGRRLPTLVNSVLGRDPAGLPRLIRTTVFDATERRGYEQELLVARRAAEDSERRVRVLQEIVADLSAAATEADVAGAVARAPALAFGADSATVWLADEHRGRLVAVVSTDQLTGRDDIPIASNRAVAEVYRRGDLHVIGSLAEAKEYFGELAETMRQAGRSSVVLLPLTTGTGDDVRGVLGFSFVEPRELTDSELRVVRLLGQQSGQALDRARLYDDARRREARAGALAAITREMDEQHRLTDRTDRLVDGLVPDIAQWAEVRLRVGPGGLVAEAGGPGPDPDLLAARIEEVTVAGEPSFATDLGCSVLPLTARGRVLGTLSVRVPPARRTPEENAFLADLADRAGLALENARLYEQERAIARTLQRSLLADHLPRDSRFAVESHYHAAAPDLEVGGDWFDAFMITRDKLAIAVGDVVGRGIDAASTMGQLRSAVRALASAESGPATVLRKLDRYVERVDAARMATVAYAEIDLAAGTMTYACAGHMPPLLHEPASEARYLMGARSGPLGSRAGKRERVEETVRLPFGSRLLLFTDGLVERRNRPIDRGMDLIAREWARRRDAPMPGLTESFADLMVGREHADDVCLLCVTIGTEERLERSIGADPVQIAALRKDLRGWLTTHGVDAESTEAVLLACSEAVANSIEHGYREDPFGRVEIVATVSPEAVEVRVADQGRWRMANQDVSRGRGLQLIRQVMDHVSFDRNGGTVVTMRRAREESA